MSNETKLTINQQLHKNSLHLWLVDLQRSPQEVNELSLLLSSDEKERGDRFHSEIHRRRFIVARGCLRKILSGYTNIEPDRLEFEYSLRGKPRLSNVCGGEIIQFNLSHSEDLALYGAIASKKIGVDLEYLRPISDALKLARRFFSPQETSAIEQLTGIARERAFLQIWTAKEAYLKAIGDGLSGEMDKLAIDLKIESDLYSFELIGEGKQAKDWYIYNFIPRPNFIATVAIENQQEELSILLN